MNISVITNARSNAIALAQVVKWYEENNGVYPVRLTIGLLSGFVSVHLEKLDNKTCLGILSMDGTKPARVSDLTGIVFDMDAKGIAPCLQQYRMTLTGVRTVNGKPVFTGDLQLFAPAEKQESEEEDTEGELPFPAISRQLIAEGISTENEIRHDVEIMRANNVRPALQRAVLQRQLETGACAETPTHVNGYYVAVDKKDTYMTNSIEDLLSGYCVLFDGGQSTGKSLLAKTLADIFNMKIIIETASATKSWQEIMAPKTTDNSAAGFLTQAGAEAKLRYNAGNKEWLEEAAAYEVRKDLAASTRVITEVTPLVTAMKNGYWYCMDEMNCMDPNVLESLLNPILDDTGYIMVPGIGRVDIHPNFRFMGTQNSGFAGTLEQNQATLSRLSIIGVPYGHTAAKQLKQALKEAGIDADSAEYAKTIQQADNLYMDVVTQYRNRAVGDQTISIRGYARALAVSINYGADIKRALIRHVFSHAARKDTVTLMATLDKYY